MVVGSIWGPLGAQGGGLPRDYTGAGARFAAIQSARLPFYVNTPPAPFQPTTIFYNSGTWTVPLGAKTVFVSATAAGGAPMGLAGRQALQKVLAVNPGDVIQVAMQGNGDVYLSVAGTVILYLFAGAAYGKTAWQSQLGQDSGIPGFGSGVDAGIPWPPIVVFYWGI